MNFFEKMINATLFEMECPTFLSPFHLGFLIAFILATVIVSIWLYKIPNDYTVRAFVAVCWGIMLLFEVYKQINFAFSYNAQTQTVVWDYDWHSFPFQFCSSPLYLFPFAVFLKDCKVRDAFLAYLCTFSFFGGLVVMIYPGSVFTEDLMINVQTMVHHGLQALVGIVLTVSYRKKFTWTFFATGTIVFAGMLSVAMFLNWFVPNVIGTQDKFTMFSLSWIYGCELPLLDVIFEKAPYIVFLLSYIVGFCFVAALIFSIIKFILFSSEKNKQMKNSNKANHAASA